MAAKLKVFTTSDGFKDYVVAVSSKPKALAAWGVAQNLFNEGLAREVDDPALVKAALAQPGQVLEYASASSKALPKTRAVSRPKGPSKAALKRVADLEDRMRALSADLDERLAAIDEERRALDARAAKLREAHDAEANALSARLSRAKAALA